MGVRGLSRVGGRPGGLGGGARGRVSRGGRVMRWEEGWAYPTLSMGGLGGLGGLAGLIRVVEGAGVNRATEEGEDV